VIGDRHRGQTAAAREFNDLSGRVRAVAVRSVDVEIGATRRGRSSGGLAKCGEGLTSRHESRGWGRALSKFVEHAVDERR
jgi:hypothetical protein